MSRKKSLIWTTVTLIPCLQAPVTPEAGCVIVMPGELNNHEEEEDDEDDDERNSETAALTSSC